MFTTRATTRPIVTSETSDSRLNPVVSHLREEEVRRPGLTGGAPAWPTTIGLPIPQTEDEDVGEPDQRSRDDQLAAVG